MIDASLPAHRIAAAVRQGAVSAEAVTQAALERIAERNGELNAYTDLTADRALSEARAVDQERAAGRPLGPLAGVPYAVKNLLDIQGLPTLAGSKINRDQAPATTDATLIRRLRAAGAVLLGGLNMGEYAYDFTGENAHYGPSRNPHDPTRMSGGSSGGSGTALAAGLAALTLGSDTNGSIRVPASLCGLFGLKPTFGRLSRAGSFPFCPSLDHLGPLARNVTDLALAYDVLQGPDPADPACTERAPEPVLPVLDQGIHKLRIAVADGYFSQGGSDQARAAVATVAAALGAARGVTLPEVSRARAAAFVITNAEGGQLHLQRLRSRAADFDPEVRDRLLAGALLPAHWYLQAQRFRHWYHQRLLAVFREVDVLIAPATPCSAPLIGQKTLLIDGREVLLRPNLGLYTQPLSFVGLPVVAAPLAKPGGLPIAVQLIAAPWGEARVLQVAAELERKGVVAAACGVNDKAP